MKIEGTQTTDVINICFSSRSYAQVYDMKYVEFYIILNTQHITNSVINSLAFVSKCGSFLI